MMLGRWGEVAVLALARISMGAQLQVVGALGPLLIGSLVTDWAALGTLIGTYSLAGVFVALPAGWLLARFGDRVVLLVGVGLMALGGVLLALAPDFLLAVLGRLVSGIGGALLTIAGAKMVLDRFSGARVALAMGLMLMAWPFGIGLALLVLPMLGEDWKSGLWLSAAFCTVAFLLIAATVRGGGPSAASHRRMWLLRHEWRPLLALGVVWAGYNASFAVAVGFTPAFLVANGISHAEAGALASLIGFSILPLQPMGGAIAERLGRPLLVTVMCILGMVAALLATAAGAPPWLTLPAFGMLAAPPSSLIMAFAGRALSAESRAFGMGVHYTVFYLGLALLPPFAGLVRDMTGSPSAPLLTAAAFLAVCLTALAVYATAMAQRAQPRRTNELRDSD
ncbi:MFS transporter [Roseomonas eburnea]|uniref:MFS transporter n=1 Tax=Neoroseomonas eburnea TaxID=1346889 RepID=A0A9X9X8Z7_9PROT|nr:MFS transporter [Neoroseomonas eburnea]MBR0680183.1 MFS transporter [Neoroseomonas eburnea]